MDHVFSKPRGLIAILERLSGSWQIAVVMQFEYPQGSKGWQAKGNCRMADKPRLIKINETLYGCSVCKDFTIERLRAHKEDRSGVAQAA
jgi:hypothetical protein